LIEYGNILRILSHFFGYSFDLLSFNFATNPFLRSEFSPPDKCARDIVAGIRRDAKEIYIPKQCEAAFKITALFPARAQDALLDFFECRVEYKKKPL
jgi:hypothetical protein